MVEINEGETYVKIVSLGKAWTIEDEKRVNDCIKAEEDAGSELGQIHVESTYVLLEFFKPLITLEEFERREWTPKELLEIYLGLDLPATHIVRANSVLELGALLTGAIREVLQNG